MRQDSLRAVTAEIEKVIEKNVRTELLKERAAQLRRELAGVERQLIALLRPAPAFPTRTAASVPRVRPALRRPAPEHKSTRVLLVETFKQAKRPMTVKELTASILRRGYVSTRSDPSKTVDAMLRVNRTTFRKTAPGTFELIR
jgi:hypothetical protein